MILVISEQDHATANKVESGTFAQLAIWERKHIQEWIRQYPNILGEELLVVSMEFDRFKNSGDRLDVLAIDNKGNLVVIELKRDGFAAYADLQVLRYAAMVSSMTIEMLLPHYVKYQKDVLKVDDPNSDAAREQIREFVTENESFVELSNKPRIILCSENFSTEITTTVLWLNQTGLDITCVRIKPHSVGSQIVIVPDKIIPLQEAKDYLIEIQQKEEVKQQAANFFKRPTTMRLLVGNKKLQVDDEIYLEAEIPSSLTLKPNRNDPVCIAYVTGELGKANSLRWKHDGKSYSISTLTSNIFQEYHPTKKHPGAIQGGKHWRNKEGRVLSDLADEVWASLQTPPSTK